MKNIKLWESYILENTDFSEYGEMENTIENLYKTARKELGHIKNDFERSKQWIMGLPSPFGLYFYNDDILQLMRDKLGYTHKSDTYLVDLYWNNIAKLIIRYGRKAESSILYLNKEKDE